MTVEDYMTLDPVTLMRDDSIRKAFHILSPGKFRHLPVVEEKRLEGIVSYIDILKAFMEVKF